MKTGRPKKEIAQDQFERCCNIHCTLTDIAGFFNCSEDTIETRCKEWYDCTFSEIYKKLAGYGNISLRRKQFEVAMAGDRGMLIWLGKQYLGQKDTVENINTDNVIIDLSELESE